MSQIKVVSNGHKEDLSDLPFHFLLFPLPPLWLTRLPPLHVAFLSFIDSLRSHPAMTRVLKAGILGATGTVGQRFILLLSQHPGFSIHALGASPRSAGKPYAKATKWKMSQPIPANVRDMIVQTCEPVNAFQECDVVFSGLDADVAGEIGMFPKKSDPPHCTSLPLLLLLPTDSLSEADAST